MNLQEIKNFIKSLHNGKRYNINATRKTSKFYIQNKDKFELILSLTSFLNNIAFWPERYYCILNDITEYPKCPQCQTVITKFTNANSSDGGYRYNKFCCSKCANIYNGYRKKPNSPKKEKPIKKERYRKPKCIVNTIEIDENDITNDDLKWLINILIFDKEKRKFRQQFSTEGNYQNTVFKRYIDAIVSRTSFLDDNVKMPERYYCILNDITEYPKCQNPNCNNIVTYFHYEHSSEYYGYQRTCSVGCGAKLKSLELPMDFSSIIKRKEQAKRAAEITKKNILKRTNGMYHNPAQLPESRKKISDSLNRIEENGKTVAQNTNEKIVRTRKPRDYEKFKRTCLIRYGVENPFQLEKTKRKSKESKEVRMKNQLKNYYNKCVNEYRDKNLIIITDVDTFIKERSRIVEFECVKCKNRFISYIKTNGFYSKCKNAILLIALI